MDCRTLAACLALAALALPSAVAEDPVVTIPKPDPSGPAASAQALQDDGLALANGAAAIAAAAPGAVFARCPPPATPEPPACDALAIPTDEAAQLTALLGQQGAALVADAAALLGVSGDAMLVAAVKVGEGGNVVAAVLQVTGPSAFAAAQQVTDAVQAHACPVAGVALEAPPAGPSIACGPDSVLTRTQAGAGAVYASAQGLLVKVDAGPTCSGAKGLVASFSEDAGDAVDCEAVPDGGMVVALMPTA